MALTLVAWRYSQQEIEQRLRLEFETEVGRVRTDLNARIAGYTQTLRGAAALFSASKSVTRKDWRDYIAGLKLEQGYPAIQAVAFARSVADSELAALVSEARKSGVSDFAARPPGHRDRYVVNVYVEPYGGLNIKALGYDMWQDADRRETMQRARDIGEPMITRRLTLKVDEQSNPVPAFIMYFPVLRTAGAEPYGYVLSPFRMPVLLDDLLKRNSNSLWLSIHDGNDVSPENIFYRSTEENRAAAARLSHSEPFVVGGRTWTLTYASQPEFEARADTSRSLQVLAGGLLTSLLLFSIAWSLATTRDRALRLAQNMTGSLRESEARFRVLVEQAPDAITVYDMDLGHFVEVNAQAEILYGCSREELLKSGPERFYPPGQFNGKSVADSVRELIERALAGEQVHVERTILNAQGRILLCELRLARLPSAGRRLIRGSFIDISERRQAERALAREHAIQRDSEERIRLLLNSTGEAIYGIDLKGCCTFCNPAGLRMLGRSLEADLLGVEMHAATHYQKPDGSPYPADECAIYRVIQTGVAVQVDDEVFFRTDGSSFPVRYSAHPIRREGEIVGVVVTFTDVSELLQAEEASRRAKRREDIILSTSPIAVAIARVADGRFLEVNDNFATLFGRRREDLIGRTSLEVGYWSTAEARAGWFAALQREGELHGHEVALLDANGTQRSVLMSSSFIDYAGEACIINFLHDITGRKLADVALHESEARFRSVFEKAAHTGMAIADPAGTLVEANETLAQMLGYSRHELIGMNIGRFTHPDDLAVELVYLTELAEGKRDEYRMNKRYLNRSGGMLWVDLLVTVIRDEQGRAVNVVGLVIDISERKRAEADLRVAAITFECQEGMMVTDADKVILRVNQAFTEITGYTSEDAVGMTPRLLSSGRHEPDFYQAMWETIERTGKWRGEIWNHRKSGDAYPQWLSITAVTEHDGVVTHYVGTFADITRRKAAEDEIKHLAFYDPLTRLPNRRLMFDRLNQALTSSARRDRHGALMLFDLDDFKTLNDTLGHDVGDQFLMIVASRIESCLREGDTVARLGGDEFVVILEDLDAEATAAMQAESVAVKIQAALNQPCALDLSLAGGEDETRSYHCTSSIGITLFRDQEVSVEELMKRADTAMYQAKAAGRNTLRFFDPDMQAVVTARAAMNADLRTAVREGQFILHYQPQVDREGRVTGAEALVRWQHPQRGMVAPAEFIPQAEDNGLILPLGHWVLETACNQLLEWATQAEMAHLTVAVNVSSRQFRQKDFVEQVLAVLNVTGANPRKLKLELTESLLLHDMDDIIEKMAALKVEGVSFSLDDFGTGYSSLSYLKRLPLGQLKIDQSFVRDILTDSNDAAIARTIIALGQSLGLAVIAEGVETEAQREFLASHGCHAYQGYLFGRPGLAALVLGTKPAVF